MNFLTFKHYLRASTSLELPLAIGKHVYRSESHKDAAAVPPGSGFKFEGCADVFGFFDHESEPAYVAGNQLSGKERQAVVILGLELPVTEDEVKARYKALVKRHHPDANGGDKNAEEKFKKINEAYEIIIGILD